MKRSDERRLMKRKGFLTHGEIVELAVQSLYRRGCAVVFCDVAGNGPERPDAIGFLRTGTSIVVEVKASLADAIANAKKGHHHHPRLGNERVLFVDDPSILDNERVTDLYAGWGIRMARGWHAMERPCPVRYAGEDDQAFLVTRIASKLRGSVTESPA